MISDYADLAGEEQEFRLIQDALRLSAHVLGRDKRQLAPQLLSRLLNRKEEHIQKLLSGASGKATSDSGPGRRVSRSPVVH